MLCSLLHHVGDRGRVVRLLYGVHTVIGFGTLELYVNMRSSRLNSLILTKMKIEMVLCGCHVKRGCWADADIGSSHLMVCWRGERDERERLRSEAGRGSLACPSFSAHGVYKLKPHSASSSHF